MKNIETILAEIGINVPEELKGNLNKAVSENYKTVSEFAKQVSRYDGISAQLQDAQETLKKFDGVDVEGYKKEIADFKARAEKAEADALKAITDRDKSDWLKGEFDRLGVTSDRVRKSLTAEIMGEDGLKWHDGKFLGFNDYIAAENEKDHFYKTEDEKAGDDAQVKAPKFTEKDVPDDGAKKFEVPIIW